MAQVTNRYHTEAIAWGPSKAAALYFDGIIPLQNVLESVLYGLELMEAGRSLATPPDAPSLAFLPDRFKNNEVFLTDFYMASFQLALATGLSHESTRSKILEAFPQYADLTDADIAKQAVAAIRKLAKNHNLGDLPIDLGGWIPPQDSTNAEPMIVVSGLNVIDVDRISWDAIAELRKDKHSLARLRRLRQFVYENYSGKDASFVRDDLLSRIHEYEEVTRTWRIETVLGSLGAALHSKTTIGAFAGSAAAVLAGAPVAALVAGGGGLVLEAGKIAVEMGKRELQLRKSLADNPVSYIANLSKRTGQQG